MGEPHSGPVGAEQHDRHRFVVCACAVLVRHGESEWNLKNLFTGWRDVGLTDKGIREAQAAGHRLKAQGLRFDVAFTSALVRAQHSLDLMLDELAQKNVPTAAARCTRRSSATTAISSGLNKDDARAKWGADQVHVWRRSYDVAPPGAGEPRGYRGARLRSPITSRRSGAARAPRRERARFRTRQFAAGADHGARGRRRGRSWRASWRDSASATAWSWWECTPPGDTRPMRWQVPPLCLSLFIRLTSADARWIAPLAIASPIAGGPASRPDPRRC